MKKTLLEAGIALQILLFMYAGVIKWQHYKSFSDDMRNQVFPLWLQSMLIIALPTIEILIAICLIPERTRRIGLLAATALLASFTVYATGALLNWFSRTPCSCGGIINTLTWPQHLVFNSFFLLLAIWCLRARSAKLPKRDLTSDTINKRMHA